VTCQRETGMGAADIADDPQVVQPLTRRRVHRAG
jgi:hypothetical protein